MSTTYSRNDELRALDSEGRGHTAPGWDGPIEALGAGELHHRIEELGAHIGRLSTNYLGSGKWEANPTFAVDAAPWIKARLACLRLVDEHGRATVR